ncbi:DNA polymerase I [Paenalcaligenes suwonensis]|uniref:DNA polymerase I n=1 Tax=Paenalcaligenes suwonensis TaxID=1202713 RepID=UPI00140CD9B2|nr:DNA polymerase I [Paenalcaligenes suwonensis]NHC61989.1 DNA polymerase I [Paenalcaligenes suwonensis]
MKQTLLLVDGSSYLYRAFHAMPDLRNARGEPTGALYGVIAMMRKILQDYEPDYMACVFDAKGKTFRDDLFSDYKANRPSMPTDLAQQIEPIHRAVRALGWPVICVPGVEADDIIGTLSVQASAQGIHSVISTGDKDLAQLVNPHVELINTMNNERQDIQGVIDRYGVRPEQIIDYLMLIGDTADNIPGVPKVGPKTAAKWLNEYQDLDTLIQHADEIKGVAGQNLRDFIPSFEMTRKLVTVKLDCDLGELNASLDQLRPLPLDKNTLLDIYEDYGFRTWLRELTGDATRIPAQDGRVAPRKAAVEVSSDEAVEHQFPEAPASIQYETVTTQADLQRWIEKIEHAELTALDTETTSLDPMMARLVGVSLSVKPGEACYIPVAHQGCEVIEQLSPAVVLAALKPWLESSKHAKILHHAKYDAHVFATEGVRLQGIAEDSMLQAYVLDSHLRVNMDDVAQRWLNVQTTPYESICGKGAKQIAFADVSVDVATAYACEDADITLRLHQVMRPLIAAHEGLEATYQLELATSSVLTTIEANGVAINADVLHKQSHELGQRLLELEAEAYELAGQPFNMNSPKQVGEILFEKLGIPVVKKTASGAPSTDEAVLTELANDYPLPKLMLEHRGIAKLKSTYTDKLPKMVNPKTNRVHTRYAQAAVVTGRLASSDPNLQNIPVRTAEGRKVRDAFVATQGKVVSADYSQIELRIMAHVSGDKNLQQVFVDGGDVHRATAAEIFSVTPEEVTPDQRYAAKAINFGLIYGMGEFGLANNLGITRAAAKAYIDRYFSRYPGVAQYMERIKEQAKDQGYVETVFGRRLSFPELKTAKGPRMAGALRAAINAPMQGTAADLIKKAMVAVQHWLDQEQLKTLMVMQVHDELVFDVPVDEVERLKEALPGLMCGIATLDVPLVAEVGEGDNWGQAH